MWNQIFEIMNHDFNVVEMQHIFKRHLLLYYCDSVIQHYSKYFQLEYYGNWKHFNGCIGKIQASIVTGYKINVHFGIRSIKTQLLLKLKWLIIKNFTLSLFHSTLSEMKILNYSIRRHIILKKYEIARHQKKSIVWHIAFKML